MDRPWIAANQRERERLHALLGRLSVSDLQQPLNETWRVATTFAHLAFWDRRAALLIQRWQQGQTPPADESDWYGAEVLNDGLLDEWNALPVSEAVRLVVDAAALVDLVARDVDDATAEAIVARQEDWLLHRWRHRAEHIDAVAGATD
ncbi:MAG: hypothetical protein WC273_03805 [Dehalococcoidia bacterium]